MAIDVSQIGQVQVTAIAQEPIPFEAVWLGQLSAFGIRIGTQRDGDGGILEQIQGAVEFDRRGLHGVETAAEDMGTGFMDGEGTAILNEKTPQFAKGRTRFEASDFHGEGAHELTQGRSEEFRRIRFKQWIIEGFVARLKVPEVIEVAM
jgi:hypothetical protein